MTELSNQNLCTMIYQNPLVLKSIDVNYVNCSVAADLLAACNSSYVPDKTHNNRNTIHCQRRKVLHIYNRTIYVCMLSSDAN